MFDTLHRSPKKKSKPGMNRGRWNQEEHRAFLKGLEIHGTTCWSAISKLIMTRTPVQTHTHYKKYDHLRRKARSFPEEVLLYLIMVSSYACAKRPAIICLTASFY